MAKGKNGFVLYKDMIHTVRKLPKDKQADLFMTILEYVNDENPVVSDMAIDLVFEPIKQHLKRDLKDWEATCKKRSEIGKEGGKKSGESRRKHSTHYEANEAIASTEADTDSETEIDIDSEKEINNNFFQMFRRAAGAHLSDKELRGEVGKFRNKYPNAHANRSGALINTWVANIGKQDTTKKMVM